MPNILNIFLKFVYHLLLLTSIGFAMFLYSDDYTIFPWATQDEALKFLHLITTIPFPLFFAFIINLLINRINKGRLTVLIKYFPLVCLVLISGFIFLINSLDSLMLQIGFGISIFLFFVELYLMVYDIYKQ